MDQKTDTRDDQQEQRRKLIYLEGKRDMQLIYRNEIKKIDHRRLKPLMPHLAKDHQTQYERYQHSTTADNPDKRLRKKVPEQAIDQKTYKRQ